jgi:hypothetical protein
MAACVEAFSEPGTHWGGAGRGEELCGAAQIQATRVLR